MKQMNFKINFLFSVILLFLFLSCQGNADSTDLDTETIIEESSSLPFTADEEMQSFYDSGAMDQQVHVQGEVIKTLRDDLEGSRHQKFILELESGQTILISHNIDLAPRVDALQEGDQVEIYGVYEWNERGGVIHWTHHDPDGDHIGGWIIHDNHVYE